MSALRDFLKEKFGSVKTASAVLGVPYITLLRNCEIPTRGWRHLERLIGKLMEERDEALMKMRFAQEEYSRLAKLYNAMIDKYSAEGDERI